MHVLNPRGSPGGSGPIDADNDITHGTVLLAHGSAAYDWLGDSGPEPTLGGITELALRLRDASFTVVVLDSYAKNRRDRIGGAAEGLPARIGDLHEALKYMAESSLPRPFHVYGKSNGGWALVSMLLELCEEDCASSYIPGLIGSCIFNW